jgi:hypothetical protein
MRGGISCKPDEGFGATLFWSRRGHARFALPCRGGTRCYFNRLPANNERRVVMNTVRTLEMQCTHSEFLRELPLACGSRPYEVDGERIVINDGGREIQVETRTEPVRHLGSLDLPIEEVTLKLDNYSEEEADKLLEDFRRPILRCGG